jgi:hypothetical protein
MFGPLHQLSARDSYETIPAGYAFATKGRTHGQNYIDRGYPLPANLCRPQQIPCPQIWS